ncbi:MAG: hypothetical protein ACM3ZE_03945, partial [Myxococcales bacterium]
MHPSDVTAKAQQRAEEQSSQPASTAAQPRQRVPDPAVLAALGSGRKKSRIRRWVLLLLLAIVVAGAGAVFYRVRSRVKPPAYEFGEARRGDLQLVVTATGTLEAKKTVE